MFGLLLVQISVFLNREVYANQAPLLIELKKAVANQISEIIVGKNVNAATSLRAWSHAQEPRGRRLRRGLNRT